MFHVEHRRRRHRWAREVEDPARELLVAGLAELDLIAADAQIETLLRLGDLLEAWSRRINLTSHRSRASIVQRLVLDAAALLPLLPELPSLADLGSGAGFPGLPMAILRPTCSVTLVEARERRHHFQRAALRELGLANATPRLGRAEDLSPDPHAAVIAQAMAHPHQALRWMLRWGEPGALLLLPGGTRPPVLPEISGVRFQECLRYRIPCGGPERTLWVGRREAP